ncbi:hypothetical protein E2C01_046948 [Portunus trituberculatus]|uniref:Uncharacterized protein n=1 Tax=Portunus trituberculatus TaxID=210409 RepID=A0A5B7G956_PORTR|nr:hypothetical protein [Portunus trituberculatus]
MTTWRQDDLSVRKCVRHGPFKAHERDSSLSSSSLRGPQHLRVLLVWEVWGAVAAMMRLRRPSSLFWAVALTFMFFLYIALPSSTPAAFTYEGKRTASKELGCPPLDFFYHVGFSTGVYGPEGILFWVPPISKPTR